MILTVRIAYFVLSSYPGSLPVRGRKGEPGTHAHVQKISRIWEICNLSAFYPLRKTRSDESAVCAHRMIVVVCLSQSFVEDVAYALSQLRI